MHYNLSFINYQLSIILLAVCLSGCTVRPRGILSGRKMEQVLYDLHRADGILQVSGVYYQKDNAVNPYYLSVMEKNGITQAQFDSSLVWYTDNPQIFNKIYPRVIRRLEKERQELVRVQGDRSQFVHKVFVPTSIDTLIAPVLFQDTLSVYALIATSQSDTTLLPPADTLVGTLGAGSVVLEVGKHRRINPNMKSVGLIRSEGHEAGGH